MSLTEEVASPVRGERELNECFLDMNERINLLNSQAITKLVENQPLTLYFKFPNKGEKRITVMLAINCDRTFKNSRGEERQIRKTRRRNEELAFNVSQLLSIRKRIKIHNN